MSSTAGGSCPGDERTAGTGSGLKPGMVVQELGWDKDTDDELRVAIEDCIDADMVDGDYGNVVDAVVLWWRDDDGDLVDGLVDALTDLVGGGVDLAADAQGRPARRRRRRRRHRGGADRGPVADHDGRGQQGLVGHAAGRAEDPRVTVRGPPVHARGPGDPRASRPTVRVLGRAGVIRPYGPRNCSASAGRRATGAPGPPAASPRSPPASPTGSAWSTSSAS